MAAGAHGVNGTHVLYLAEGRTKGERVYVIIRHRNTVEMIAPWMAQLIQNLSDVTKIHAKVS